MRSTYPNIPPKPPSLQPLKASRLILIVSLPKGFKPAGQGLFCPRPAMHSMVSKTGMIEVTWVEG